MEQQPRLRHRQENFDPQFNRRRGNFRKVIKTAKSNIARSQERRHVWLLASLRAARNTNNYRAAESFPRYIISSPIREDRENDRSVEINGIQPGRAAVPEISELDRSGFARKEQEPVIGGMQCQIDEHVDLVLPDHGRGPFIGDAGNVAPMIDMPAAFGRQSIGPEHIGVSVDLEVLAIVLAKEMQDSATGDVGAKIWGNVADAQAPPGGSIVEVRADVRGERFGMHLIPSAMLVK